MGRYRLKKMHKGDNPIKEKYRTKRKTKDMDQIHADMQPDKAEKLLKQEVDYDKSGAGQFYCLHCAKYCINEKALKDHFKSKPHKRRLKNLETSPYSQEEAERASGMGSYIPPTKKKVYTQGTEPKDKQMDTENT